ncbi:MAG TPA: chemotaxis protein CheD [Spirochaetota bacterium]|nr:chemotaxis protein CheD [Spirochaetota bacterium]HPJ34368.1 chemotaxis protein CheD [Spirochaetota bacterium]
MKRINIHIGEYYSSAEPVVISTILGPCVSVCLYDRGTGTGGMNHILLPGQKTGSVSAGGSRYAMNAMELLINQMMKLGADRYRLKAKVFGGAQIFSCMKQETAMGLKNIEMVVDFLKTEKIPIVNYNFGGYEPRRIFFYTGTGDVLLQKIKSSEARGEFEDLRKKIADIEKKINCNKSIFFLD